MSDKFCAVSIHEDTDGVSDVSDSGGVDELATSGLVQHHQRYQLNASYNAPSHFFTPFPNI